MEKYVIYLRVVFNGYTFLIECIVAIVFWEWMYKHYGREIGMFGFLRARAFSIKRKKYI